MSDKSRIQSKLELTRSGPIFQAALRLGLPIEISPHGDTRAILSRSQLSTRADNPCQEFKDQCWAAIHKVTMDITKEMVDGWNAGLVSGHMLDTVTKSLGIWEFHTVVTVCVCGPNPGGVPDPPGWKKKKVTVYGQEMTWQEAGDYQKNVDM